MSLCAEIAIPTAFVAAFVAANADIIASTTTIYVAIVVAVAIVAVAAVVAPLCACVSALKLRGTNTVPKPGNFSGSNSITPSLTLSCSLSLPPSLGARSNTVYLRRIRNWFAPDLDFSGSNRDVFTAIHLHKLHSFATNKV